MAIVATVVIAVPCVLVVSGPRLNDKWFDTYDACPEVERLAQATTVTPPWPFGAVDVCWMTDSERHYFGEVEVSVYYYVQAEAGPVGLRVDYTGLDAGRQYQSRGHEVAADDMPGLTRDEERLLEDAVRARGGVHPYEWMLHYGDG